MTGLPFSMPVLKLQRYVGPRGIDMHDCFKQYNIFQRDEISEDHFRRGIDYVSEAITGSDVDELVEIYRNGSNVNFAQLVCDVNTIFEVRDIYADPFNKSLSKEELLGYTEWKPKEFSEELEIKVTAILQRVCFELVRKNIDFEQGFKEFDSHSKGIITMTNFLRTFPVKLLQEEIHLLAEKYNEDPKYERPTQQGSPRFQFPVGMVRYKNLARDLLKLSKS